MLRTTQRYDGVIDDIWMSHTTLGERPNTWVLPWSPDGEIEALIKKIQNATVGSVTIEAAHIYLDEDLNDPGIASSLRYQARLAGRLCQRLQDVGISTTRVLFVDDYNVDPAVSRENFSPRQLLDLVTSEGYSPDVLLYEADMVPLAKKIIEALGSQGLTSTKDDNLLLTRKSVNLYDPTTDRLSCAMLDAALSLVKLEHCGEGAVNVLPKMSQSGMGYRHQQLKMRTIVGEHLNTRVLPIFNLFSRTTGSLPEASAGAHNTFRKPQKKIRYKTGQH